MNTKLILGIILAAPMAILFVWYLTIMIVEAIRGDKDFQAMLAMMGLLTSCMIGVALITEALL